MAVWSAVVFLVPLVAAAGAALAFREHGDPAAAAAGVGGLLAGAGLARAVFFVFRPRPASLDT